MGGAAKGRLLIVFSFSRACLFGPLVQARANTASRTCVPSSLAHCTHKPCHAARPARCPILVQNSSRLLRLTQVKINEVLGLVRHIRACGRGGAGQVLRRCTF